MASDNSFDIVSTVDMQEVDNAINQAKKEIETRYDLKGTKCSIELNQKEKQIIVIGDDDYKVRAVVDILQSKLIRRGVPIKNLKYGKVEDAANMTMRQEITIQSGIESEVAKAIVKSIKDKKMKVQASIQGDQVRVTGKKRDDLQEVIAHLKTEDFGVELQFTNYR